MVTVSKCSFFVNAFRKAGIGAGRRWLGRAEGHATRPGSEPSDSENPLMNARLPSETEAREAQEDR